MINSGEKTFSISSARLSSEYENERSAKAKLSWGIALLVLSQIIFLIIIIVGASEISSASSYDYYYRSSRESSVGSMIFWYLIAIGGSIVGTILLIVGIVGSVRYGKRVAAISKCRLRVSQDRIYGSNFNSGSGTAREFSIAHTQLTGMSLTGNTLNLMAGSNSVHMNYLANPAEAYKAICQQREVLGLPPVGDSNIPYGYMSGVQQVTPARSYQQAPAVSTLQPVNNAAQTKYCTECGCQIPGTARFCPKCGSVQE